jgi:cellulose biosynthesis protein BcsQ
MSVFFDFLMRRLFLWVDFGGTFLFTRADVGWESYRGAAELSHDTLDCSYLGGGNDSVALMRSYAVWNNKGGVGKSTISFHLAARFAETHPKINVLVIDACPQANVSMLLLGGGTAGENNVLSLCTQASPLTIVGYLSHVIAAGAGAALPNPMTFVTDVAQFNQNLTGNLFLLCGDGNMEPMAPAISGAAAAPPLTPQSHPWRWIHLILRALIDSVCQSVPNRDWLVILDTNPSFSIYTELAISAADRLLVPVNADDSSRVATNAMFILLHGQTPPHPVYGSWTFATRAQTYNVIVPQIHVVVGNRLTQYEGAATAFSALSDATAGTLFAAYQNHPQYFTPRPPPSPTVASFRDNYSVALRDFNTAGVVAAHLGRRLSQMTGGYYQVHGQNVQINSARVAECVNAIDALLAMVN